MKKLVVLISMMCVALVGRADGVNHGFAIRKLRFQDEILQLRRP